MFDNIMNFFKKFNKKEEKTVNNSKEAAKERLHLVLMQDRANVSADFLELMKQEIIEVIKKYIDVDETAIDVRLTNKENTDGTNGAPALYANIPILNIKNETRKVESKQIEDKKTEIEEMKKEEKTVKKEKIDKTKNEKSKLERIDKKDNIDEVKEVKEVKEEIEKLDKKEKTKKEEIKENSKSELKEKIKSENN